VSEGQRAARYSDLFGAGDPPGDRRSADHPSDCAYCPFCATVAVVRKTHPELLEHLAAAARELIAAAGVLVEEASKTVAPPAPPEAPAGDPGPGNVRWIDAV
jgi:hypothetical protein